MNIINIREAGSNTTLTWAISNGADIKNDEALASLINDEMCYLVTLGDVNFFELFRLVQMYREKVRIIDEKAIDVPNREELAKQFNGAWAPDPEKDPETKKPMYEIVENAMNVMMNLVHQMGADNDIISPGVQQMFVPMLCRKFDVQIPVGFFDFVSSMNEDEAKKCFTADYPATLQEIVSAEVHGVKNVLYMGFVKGTSILQYSKRYDQYLRAIKYAPIKTDKTHNKQLYRFGLLGFHKYDNLTRGEVRCMLTPSVPDKETFVAQLRRLNQLQTPLKVSFAVEMPINYMMILENAFSREDLDIMYESSMATIIDGGIVCEDFITPNIDPETENPDEQEKLKQFDNQVTAYKVRIAEANETVLKSIPILINDPEADVDVTGAFAMLPSIYRAKAVFTLDITKPDKFINFYHPAISGMFQEMFGLAANVQADIVKNSNSNS